jgi:predicted RNA binding protein YcfA (HicA-like mRNA interferase family)
MSRDRGFQPKVVELLKKAGWEVNRSNHCHVIYCHPEKTNSIPVPYRLNHRGLALSILRNQAGLDVRL